ncbi:TfoX/Sxy family protein [Sinorhizobium sp. BJ1]|uniref:TfoX/Sxy family protein n=1 Tax=Sinorhizobium sp. BJ1 TaxID=2035455 RepID=UPI000BE7EE6E|nr:TfoX/Sxy family protein [Sinorhizobium sp. BJ1]PDT84443.1 competence protein TfoX [Sinorhizobium sp. BJ1]
MDNAAIEEMFETLGPISIRRMFGGKGIYCDGVILAVEVDGEILLKGDAETAPEFEGAGGRQWAYDGKGKPVKMPYWSIPEAAYDEPEEMARWVKLAYAAARRAKK